MASRQIAFLTDENIAPRVVQALRVRGYDVLDIKEQHLAGLSDHEVLQRARKQRRVILTHDQHFAHALVRPPARHSGIVIIRFSNLTPPSVAERLLFFLQPRVLKRMRCRVVLVTDDSATILH